MRSPSFFWEPAKHASHKIQKFISTVSAEMSHPGVQGHGIDRGLCFPFPWATHQSEYSGGMIMIRPGPYRSHRRGAMCASFVVGIPMGDLRVDIQPHACDNGGCGNLPRRTHRTDAWPRSSPTTSQVSIGYGSRNQGRAYQASSVPDVCRMRPSELHYHFRSLVNFGLYLLVSMINSNTSFPKIAENGRTVCVVVWVPERP